MWTPKYENGCLIMLKYALEALYAPEPLCDCLHQVVTFLKDGLKCRADQLRIMRGGSTLGRIDR